MALSVSEFPESSSRSASSDDPRLDPTLGDSPEALKILMSGTRIQGFFNKKSDLKFTARPDVGGSGYTNSSPPLATFHSPAYILQHQEEGQEQLDFQVHMPIPIPLDHLPIMTRRPQALPQTPPKKTGSPMRIQSSLTRLEIGAGTKAPPPNFHVLPKPPTVIIEDWNSSKDVDPPSSPPRPLPSLPVTSSTSSRRVRQPVNALASSSKVQLEHIIPMSSIPLSKVISPGPSRVSSPPLPKAPVSVRQKPTAGSANTVPSTDLLLPASLRPLPVPPPGGKFVPPPARVRRPRSSPNSNGSVIKSPRDAIPSSWASRPTDLRPAAPVQEASATLPLAPPPVESLCPVAKSPRTRSQSQPRWDRTFETINRKTNYTPPPKRAGIVTPPISSPETSSSSSSSQLPSLAHGSPRIKMLKPLPSPRLQFSQPTLNFRTPALHSPPLSPILSVPLKFYPPTIPEAGSKLSDAQSKFGSQDDPPSPTSDSLDSPIAVFIDDNDLITAPSREPSPIRYARRGSNSSDEFISLSRSRSRSRRPRHRAQLRSYSNAFWAPSEPEENGYILSRSPSPIHYARRLSIDEDDKVAPRTQPRSYLFDFGRSLANGKENGNPARYSSPDINKSRLAKGFGLMTNLMGSGPEDRKSRSQSPRNKRKSAPQPALAPLRRPVEAVLDISLSTPADESKTSVDNLSTESQSGPDSSSVSTSTSGHEHNRGGDIMPASSSQRAHPFYPHRRVASSNAMYATQHGIDLVDYPRRTSEGILRNPAEISIVHHDALRPQGRRDRSLPVRFTDFGFTAEKIPSPSSPKKLA